ncbi:MAG: class I adenylate-forming enzyme family protein [Phenylobacterium sp.]
MLDAYIAFQARVQPHVAALISPSRWLTYAQMDAEADRFAAGLRALGVAPASGVVALSIGDEHLKHVVFAALARLSVVTSPGEDPGADLYVCDWNAAEAPRRLYLSPEWIAATRALAAAAPVEPVRGAQDDVVRVMLSSGTTRTARRVARTWRQIEDNSRTAALTYLARKGGRWVAMTGLDTGLGQAMALAAWACGATLVTDVNAEWLAPQIEVLQPTVIGLTPIQLRNLLSWLPPGFVPPPGLRLVLTGSVLTQAVAREARLRLSQDIVISYGATECGSTTMGPASLLEEEAGAAGYPVPGARVDIVGAGGQVLPAGQSGEIRIVTERTSAGYIGDPEATAKAFREDGFYPGDVGRLRADGLLVIEGRADDRMIVSGRKFLPNLMEEAAMACPGVMDAAAFAVPDAQGIDYCCLAVVQGPGFDRDRLADEIRARGEALPPVRFAFTDAIPRNEAGKVERERLRRDVMAVLGLA